MRAELTVRAEWSIIYLTLSHSSVCFRFQCPCIYTVTKPVLMKGGKGSWYTCFGELTIIVLIMQLWSDLAVQ